MGILSEQSEVNHGSNASETQQGSTAWMTGRTDDLHTIYGVLLFFIPQYRLARPSQGGVLSQAPAAKHYPQYSIFLAKDKSHESTSTHRRTQ